MPTERVRGGVDRAVPGVQVNRSLSVSLMIAAVLLAVVAVSALTYMIVSKNKTDSSTSGQETVNGKAEAPATTPTQPTNDKLSVSAKQPAPSTRPDGATRFATSMYDGVNLRSQPSQESNLVTAIGKGRGVWVFNVSDRVDSIYIQSDKRYVTDNWSYVQLSDDPSKRGWIFSGFLSK